LCAFAPTGANGQRARDDGVRSEGRGKFLFVTDAVLRRHDRRRRRLAERATQRLDRAVGIVGLDRNDREVGRERFDRGQVARRIGNVVTRSA